MTEGTGRTISLSSDALPRPLHQQNVPTASLLCNGSVQNKTVRFGSLDPAYLTLLKRITLPLVTVCVLAACMLIGGQLVSLQYCGLALVAFLISAQVLSPLDLRNQLSARGRTRKAAVRIFLEWICVAAVLVFVSFAFKLTQVFARDVILGWLFATPVALLIVDSLSVLIAKWLATDRSIAQRYIIIGANDVGLELARRIAQSQGGGKFFGFFDYRSAGRLSGALDNPVTANCSAHDFADFERTNSITRVYLALPISPEPRIEERVKRLRDPTASI